MKALTLREKILLLLLTLVLIFVGSFTLLILPLHQENQLLEKEVNFLANQKFEMQLKISQNKKYLQAMEESHEEIASTLSNISDPIETEWYDVNLTSFAKSSGIELNAINYEAQRASFPEVDYNDQNKVHYELEKEIEKLNNPTLDKSETKSSDYQILVHPVTLEFNASPQKMASFISKLYSDKETIYVRDLSYDYDANKGQLAIDIYSIRKTSNKSLLESKKDSK